MFKTFATFKDLNLPAPLFGALERMNFISPTPIQAASLPPALEGKDILGTAQTGTGKTAAFGIPMLTKLYPNPGMRALILAPTRELAAQIHKVLKKMGDGMHLKGALLVGGESFFRQKKEVKEGADYYVCTPGRLLDHLDAGLKLTRLSVLVLDEVDRMLDMGFAPQLQQIVPHVPKERQTLLFAATLPKEILAVAANYLKDPVRVNIGTISQPIGKVKQENVATTHLNKNDLLLQHLSVRKGRVLIFVRTQRRTDRLFHFLERKGFAVASLHGGRTQGQRKEALGGFHNGTFLIMVATDLAGRGIDVDDIECVINYDLPGNREDYIHRIGRTARNGKTGSALNYLTPNDNEGRNIISTPAPKFNGPRPFAGLARPNKPGWQNGGWENRGGRNRPEYHKRTPAEGYGKGHPKRKSNKKSFGFRSDKSRHVLAPLTTQRRVFRDRPPLNESTLFRNDLRREGNEERKPFGFKHTGHGPRRPFGPKRQPRPLGGKRHKSYFGQPPQR